MELKKGDGPGGPIDKGKLKGGKATTVDAYWGLFGLLLAIVLVYFVVQSSQTARTVPIESYSPDGTRVPAEGCSR